jgi:polar amino acid transport system substrate-binding protein
MYRLLLATVGVAVVCACSTAPTAVPAQASAAPAAVADLAPSGRLRAAINFGNPILAVKDIATGEPRGVSVDLARELGRRLGVPVELVTYNAAGKVVEGIRPDAWDVAFLAIDPERAAELAFTSPYVIIEGAYLVAAASPIRGNADVDRAGVRIAVGAGSAYDLYLTRELAHATLVRAPSSPAVTDLFLAQGLDAAAGVRQQLEADARRIPGLRLLDGHFMVIRQALATPRGRTAGVRYLETFIEEAKGSGFVAQSLARHRIEGAAIAPATPVR